MLGDRAFEIYRRYVSIKLHFEGKFDASRGGTTRMTRASFDRKPVRFKFIELARRIDPDDTVGFVVANTRSADFKVPWIHDLLDEDAIPTWRDWVDMTTTGLDEHLVRDYEVLRHLHGGDFTAWLRAEDGDGYPRLARSLMGGQVSVECYISVCDVAACWDTIDASVSRDDPLWPTWSNRARRYKAFVSIDPRAQAKLLREVLTID